MGYFSFQLHITDQCDQRCRHCYIFSRPKGSLLTMDAAQLDAVLAKCAAMCSRFSCSPYFYITGGDPLLSPYFEYFVRRLAKTDIPYTVMGNPFHLDGAAYALLKETGCRAYQLSVDGLRETHDYFRKPGSFDATVEKIKFLKDAGLPCSIMTTVSGRNIEEVPAIIKLMADAGAAVYAFARWCPASGSNGITPQRYRELLAECRALFRRYEGCGTRFAYKDHLWTLYLYETGEFTIPKDAESGLIYEGCHCGNSHLSILPDGSIYACRRFESKVGNIFTDDPAEVWLGEKMEAYRDFSAFKKCSRCELLAWCRGCPATACSAGGSFYSPDPQCWKE